MRFPVLFLAAALFPLISVAQSEFAPGTYELANGTKGAGKLEYQAGTHPKLLVKDDAADPSSKAGKKGQAYSPEDVRSFDIGGDHYVLVNSIKLDSGMPMTMSMTKKDDFAKVLETGKLELLQYQMFFATMGHFPAPGTTNRTSTAQNTTVLLLRRQGEDNAVMVPVADKKYREVLTDFLKGRPDLLKKLNKKPASEAEFRTLIQDYNAGPAK